MGFYKIVFTITMVVAILVLTGMGLIMLLGNIDSTWPPDVSECPDYWTVTGAGACSANPAIGNVGSGGSACATFNEKTSCGSQGCGAVTNAPGSLKAGSGRCNRQVWANKCGVYWDGISDISPNYCAGGGPSPAPSPAGPPSCDCSKCSL